MTISPKPIILFLGLVLVSSSLGLQNQTYHIPNPVLQSIMTQLCANLDDQISCLSNIQSRLPTVGQPDPTSVLTAAMAATADEANAAIKTLSNFNSFSSASSREQIAVGDCKELLDLSVTELGWSMNKMRSVRSGGSGGGGDTAGDLQTWLSAALSNQDTCSEGFDGTNQRLQKYIRGSLNQVTQMVSNVLTLYTQLHALPFKPPRRTRNPSHGTGYPEWLTEGDKKALKGSRNMQMDAVVAEDGSAEYRTIMEAINAAPTNSKRRYIIYVKKGIYNENVEIKKKKINIMMIGDGEGVTVITGNRNFMQGWTTFRTATFAVSGSGFIAKDMTFRNTAGPNAHQAVALRVDSDQSAFYHCGIEGYQDTLYAHSLRQFYRECSIYGTIDFIFGNGAVVIQSSNIYTRAPLSLQKVTITAQGRKSPHQSTGFSIQDSFVYATQPAYLGRPWKQYSRVVYMHTYMGAMVQPRGWLEWYGNFALNTLYFAEYRNYGPGSFLAGRVKWPGFHIIRDVGEALFFTVERFIDGMSWLPATGVKFSAGLSN